MTLRHVLFAVVLATPAWAADAPEAVIVLQVTAPLPEGEMAEGLPPRFLLLEDGRVFVGGSREVASGKLEGAEVKALEREIDVIRKAGPIPPSVSFSPAPARYRLVVRRKSLDLTAAGDPADAPQNLRALAAYVDRLARFDHPGLRAYKPATYVLDAREGRLPGGCRTWPSKDAPLTPGTRTVGAAAFAGWPTGSHPASVCAGNKSFIVTLRPSVPGDTP